VLNRTRARMACLALSFAATAPAVVVASELTPEVTDIPINGNATITITLPFNTNGLNVDHYQFAVVGNGYTWTLTNVASGSPRRALARRQGWRGRISRST